MAGKRMQSPLLNSRQQDTADKHGSQLILSSLFQGDPVDGGVQLLVLSMQIACRGGQTLVIHQNPDRLQVLAVR